MLAAVYSLWLHGFDLNHIGLFAQQPQSVDTLCEQAHCSSLANYNLYSSYLPSLMPIITVVWCLTSDPSLGVLINCHCSENFGQNFEFEEGVSIEGIRFLTDPYQILYCNVFFFSFFEILEAERGSNCCEVCYQILFS